MKDYLEKRREELRKRGEGGFTLMEMLIVVAIIAVLIAIAIPVFTSQLENSREATDAANLRSAYAVASAEAMTTSTNTSAGPIKMTQNEKEKWTNTSLTSQKVGTATLPTSVKNEMYVNVDTDGKATITESASYEHVVDPVSGKVVGATS